MFAKILLVGLGGALGAVLRFLAGEGAARWLGSSFPYGTLLVNVLGCALIGAYAGWSAAAPEAREGLRLFVVTGFLGGFTTFSAFGRETFDHFRAEQFGLALFNIGLNVCIGLVAVWIGYSLAAR